MHKTMVLHQWVQVQQAEQHKHRHTGCGYGNSQNEVAPVELPAYSAKQRKPAAAAECRVPREVQADSESEIAVVEQHACQPAWRWPSEPTCRDDSLHTGRNASSGQCNADPFKKRRENPFRKNSPYRKRKTQTGDGRRVCDQRSYRSEYNHNKKTKFEAWDKGHGERNRVRKREQYQSHSADFVADGSQHGLGVVKFHMG